MLCNDLPVRIELDMMLPALVGWIDLGDRGYALNPGRWEDTMEPP